MKVVVKNAGAVEDLEFDLDDGGGFTVISGSNGCGKSTVIESINAVIDHDGSVPIRDHQAEALVVVGGAMLRQRTKALRSGDMGFRAISSRRLLPLARPAGKSVEVRESCRREALCDLAGATVDRSAFAALVNGEEELETIVSDERWNFRNVIDVVDGVKRDFQAAARRFEDDEARERGAAASLEESAKGLPPRSSGERFDYKAELTRAERKLVELETLAAESQRNKAAVENAKRAVESLGERGTGSSVADAAAKLVYAQAEVARLEEELSAARGALLAAKRSDETERDHAKVRKASEEMLASANQIRIVEQSEIDAVKEQIAEAQRGIEDDALQCRADEARKKSTAALKRAEVASGEAARLRRAADRCGDVMENALRKVLPEGLSLQGGRFYFAHKRGVIPFDELSDGEALKLTIEIGIAAVGEGGMLTLDQWAYSELDPQTRADLDQLLKRARVNCLTALASDGTLRSERLGEELSQVAT